MYGHSNPEDASEVIGKDVRNRPASFKKLYALSLYRRTDHRTGNLRFAAGRDIQTAAGKIWPQILRKRHSYAGTVQEEFQESVKI